MSVWYRWERARLWRGLWLGQVVILALGLIVYRWAGHSVVEAAYDGRSVEFLNRAIEGRGSVPLGLYLTLADSWVGNLVAAALLLILAQAVLYLLWRRRVVSSRETSPRGFSASDAVRVDAARVDAVRVDAVRNEAAQNEVAQNEAAQTEVAQNEAGPMPVDSVPATLTPGTLSPAKKLLFSVIVILIPVLFVTVPYGIRYGQYMGQLDIPPGLEDGTYVPPEMPELTPDQLLQIGSAHKGHAPPLRSYLNHPVSKPAGTIRIGIFGGSVSLGEEAALEHDISTHLERLLEEAGTREIEVINFGVSGFGVSQAALMWEYVGSRYDLDYVIMMPLYFHARRDNSFLHTDHHYGPLHGVYVTENDTLQYVPVIGRDRLDSCRRYFSFLQPAQYWRYDTRVPMAFRPLLPSPLSRRGNPFYYRKDVQEATVETYRNLFRRVASEVGNLVVYTDPVLLPDLTELQSDSIYVFASRLDELRRESSSFYRAPFDHPSGIGYEIYATELAALLLGKEKRTYRMLGVSDDFVAPETDAPGTARVADPALAELAEAENLVFAIDGSPVGELRRRSSGEKRWGRLAEPIDFGREGVVSLAAYTGEETRVFIPLPFLMREGDEVAVRWTSDGDTTYVPVGRVTSVRGAFGRISVDWGRLAGAAGRAEKRGYSGRARSGGEFGEIQIYASDEVEEFELLIGGRPALTGETREFGRRLLPRRLHQLLLGRPWVGTSTALRPLVSRYAYFRGCEGHYVDVNSLDPGGGSIDLEFRDGSGRRHSVPFLRYDLVTIEGAPFEPVFGAPLPMGEPR